jgi:hypothetical protein
MVRDVCLVITTAAMLGFLGWVIATDVRNRRELDGFRERLAGRMAPAWTATVDTPELAEGEGYL